MSNITQFPRKCDPFDMDIATGKGIAVDSFMALKDGGDRKKVANDFADALATCAKDCRSDENRALLYGFLSQWFELIA